jgi:hypothetical protein
MPILFSDTLATFEGRCTVEEADALLDWLRRRPEPVFDLAACDALHAALLQLLLAAGAVLAAPPADPVLAECLAAAGLRQPEQVTP